MYLGDDVSESIGENYFMLFILVPSLEVLGVYVIQAILLVLLNSNKNEEWHE
jgi:hypothetical protein